MSAGHEWSPGEEMRRARLAFFAAGGLGISDLAITEEHRAEGLASYIVEILDHPDMAPTSLPEYRNAVRLAFETAAANTEQPIGRP